MDHLSEIQRRVNEITARLNAMYPHFKADSEISGLVIELKEYAQAALKEVQGQLRRGELTDFEQHFIEPALSDAYMKGISKMRKGMTPGEKLNDLICETDSTISYWISEIKAAEKKVL